MDRVLELTLSNRMAQLFNFLKNNKTLTLRKDNYIKLVYFLPCNVVVYPIAKRGLSTKVISEPMVDGWRIIRQLDIAMADNDLLAVLEDLTISNLKKNRTGNPVMETWLLDRVQYGLYEASDVIYLVRYLFSHGYSFEDVTGVFTSLTRRRELSAVFLSEMTKLYKGVSA